ncbi:vesicular transport protein [Trichoderma compactum]
MLQRIKGAIDRSIAEEQARQQKALEASSSASQSASTSRRNESALGRRARPKNAGSDAVDAATNPDPAIFEAAFVIDDSDGPSRAGTPKPAPPEKDATDGEATGHAEAVENSNANADAKDGPSRDGAAHATKPAPTLTPELRQKLRKLEKLESTYPELLRSYRLAHRRATAIEPFEKALRENTPLASIGDPESLVEYLNQLKLKGDMVMDELKRVSSDKEDLQKLYEKREKKMKDLQDELGALKAEREQEAKKPESNDTAEKESGGDGDFFSYDEEIPQLQAEIAAKNEEIDSLKAERDGLKEELSTLKQDTAVLAEKLEKSALQLSESRESSASQDSLQAQLEARKTEITSLADRLDKSEKQNKDLEAQLETEKQLAASKAQEVEDVLAKSIKQASQLAGELSKAEAARNISKNLIDDLSSQVDLVKKERAELQTRSDEVSKKVEEMTKIMEESAKQPPTPGPVPTEPASTLAPSTTGGGGNKKKKKKGRGGGGATSSAPPASPSSSVAPGTPSAPDADQGPDTSALEAEITNLKEELAGKDKEIERLSKRRKTEDDLREEIETLQENLINIGQDHVEDKQRIKELEAEKAELKTEITALEKKMAVAVSENEKEKLQALQKDYDSMKDKFATAEADIAAANQLAQSRFKDVADLREALQSLQPEIKSLRKDSADIKIAKGELAAKAKELSNLDKKVKDLERDLASARQEMGIRVSEIGILKNRLAIETEDKEKAEDAQRVSARDYRRSVAEKVELSAKAEKRERALEKAQDDLSKASAQVKELEEQAHKLKREKAAAQEEAEFKTKQYTTAQDLLSSMRDQQSEMKVQLKEQQSQSRSLGEELGEVQHLLQERTQEGETMRRLLAESEQQGEAKLREMRNRIETITAEQERLDAESSSMMRKHVKQTADLKTRIKELDAEVKDLHAEKAELEERERSWRRRREELESIELRTETESTELRNTISSLRSALDASELQVRDGEKIKANLRKEYESLQLLHDKLSKELKAAQTKAAVAASGVGQSRSSSGVSTSRTSMDSTRTAGAAELSDMDYLKTILLQFLQQKDGRLRTQLVPVLGRILKFDKDDEKKWMTAVQHIEVR